MAMSAMFSVLEVVPLTLLTLDAWHFVRTTGGQCDVCGKPIAVPHKWAFYFLMSVGFWSFVGAGMFGFLINLPIVSYYEVGTILTPNHGHAALMGVFGMLALAMMVFVLRQTTDPENDSPAVLKKYGERFNADFNRWTFLTGTKQEIAALASGSLKLDRKSTRLN